MEVNYLKPAAFDKKVAELISKDFAKQFRTFLKNPDDIDAILTVPVSDGLFIDRAD